MVGGPGGPGGGVGPPRRPGAVDGATSLPAALPRTAPSSGGIRTVLLGLRPFGTRISHALGITSPRRAAILVVVICAMALSVAVPLRNYLSQRSELSMVRERQEILSDQVAELERRRALAGDPAHVEAQARERLRYVRPGETPYVVQLPAGANPPSAAVEEHSDDSWFNTLWETIVGE